MGLPEDQEVFPDGFAVKTSAQGDLFAKAMERPPEYASLNEEDQWIVDKQLGILDWDGSCPHKDCAPCEACWTEYKKTHYVPEVMP